LSFGRRLALFFLLIVLVPTLALLAVVLFVSEESRSGKADARLAAGLDTATGLYADRAETAEPEARALALDPALAEALVSQDQAGIRSFAEEAVAALGLEGVEVLGPDGEELASAGGPDAVAFASIRLAQSGQQSGTLRVSETAARDYVAEVGRLTRREVVMSRSGRVVGATVEAPVDVLDPGETEDIRIDGREFRAHRETLDPVDEETLLILGPSKEGGFLPIGRSAALVIIGFLLLAGTLGYVLTRALARLHARVAEQAETDPLTGVFNRRRFWDQLSREVERALRFHHQLSLLIFDVDDFKRINDEHGHLTGDEVIKTMGRVAGEVARSIDFAARYGGDEFAIILIETDAEGAATFAERLRSTVRETEIPVKSGGTLTVTVSVGAATVPDAATEIEALIHAADTALLEAKRSGKDQIRSAPGGG
jgi:diguanylate cyclase (GGDEF)-like protein